MKILFDHQIFTLQKYGGVSKYFAEVIHRLPPDSYKISAWLSNNEYAKNYSLFKMTSFLPNKEFRGQSRIMSLIGNPYSAYIMLKEDYDIVHQTNFDTYLIPFIKNKPMVTTYHDVNFLTEHNYSPRMIRLQTKSLERANGIVAISENTKKDMLKYFDIDPNKIRVIHHGIDTPNIPDSLNGRVVEEPYILYVGMRHLFKNFKNFARAFAIIANRWRGVKIVCTRMPFSNEELALFKELKIDDRMKVVLADEMTLNRLYRDALFFIFPSVYEGFGMPILEAMANGCPTAISKASCFPEIAADASLYFDPNDIESMAAAMEKYLNSTDIRRLYSAKGLERAKYFSWQKCADQHYQFYKDVIANLY